MVCVRMAIDVLFQRKRIVMYNYIIKFKNSQIYNKIAYLSVFLITVSIFFQIKYAFLTKEAHLTGGYSDFTSISLYLSDILLFTTWGVLILPRGREFLHVVKPLKWLILAIFLSFIYNFKENTGLGLYFLIKWLELIVAYGTFTLLFQEYPIKSLFLRLFVYLASIQSIFAILQFYKQSSIGLYRLGESHLSPTILGVAKIVSHGTTYIRGYGSFPHPNPLSAILVAGIIMGSYLYLKAKDTKNKVGWGILTILNIVGLTTTFSRGAFISLLVGLGIFLGYSLFKRTKGTWGLIYIITSVIFFSIFTFKPLLLVRTTFSDQATIDRMFYNQAGIQMSIKNPLLGVGAGESVLHMEQYSGKPLNYWEKQPPHNYFIITAAEIGIPALLFLLWFIFSQLKNLYTKLKSELTPIRLLLTTILISLLVLMRFDHYFYTLQQTQLFLWIFIALVSSETKKSISQLTNGEIV